MSLPSYLQSLEQVLNKNVSTASTVLTPNTGVGNAVNNLPTFLSPQQLTTGLGGAAASNTGKLKVLLVSTHIQQVTGYSKVSYGLIRTMAKQPWLSLTHYGFQKNPQMPPNHRMYPHNVRSLDAASTEQPGQPGNNGFGFVALPETIRQEKPDVVIIYNDMAVITRFLEEIRKGGVTRNFKIWLYVDQVYNCQLQMYLDVINRDADRVFTFTKYWRQCLKDQGITRPVDVLQHGFDADIFKPISRLEARKKLNIPADAFVYVSLNRNQPRKRYDLLLMGFVELLVKYPTKPIFMLCICDKGEKGGWPIFELFTRELRKRGVPVERFGGRLMLTSQDMSFRDEEINMFYNVADVGVTAADGEGWGLCSFEQMGVGVPQVVPDIGGYKEFCLADNSVLVKPSTRYYLPMAYCPVFGEAEACDPHDICIGMEEYLLDSDKKKKHGEAARSKVLEYTWEKVTETFLKRLKNEHEEKEEENT
jgi:glycosyltransferase involved in cell wall biosynthesis